jgi:hypothetical protein
MRAARAPFSGRAKNDAANGIQKLSPDKRKFPKYSKTFKEELPLSV